MGAPDVVSLVEDVRREVERRRTRGDLTPEDVEAVVDQRLRAYVADAKIDPKLGDRLMQPNHDWNINTAYWIPTARNRSRPIAVAIRLAKRVTRPLVRLYTDEILNRQAQLNVYMWQFLNDSSRRTLFLELEVKKLRHEIDLLKHGPTQATKG